MIRLLILLVAAWAVLVWLSGCAPTPPPLPPTTLEQPDPRLLEKIKDLPPIKVGDEFVKTYAVCRAEYGKTADVARGLQGYVRVIHSQKP